MGKRYVHPKTGFRIEVEVDSSAEKNVINQGFRPAEEELKPKEDPNTEKETESGPKKGAAK